MTVLKSGSLRTVTITGYGSNGEGVARLDDGRVVFVRGAARDDICQVVITDVRPKSCRAEIKQLIKPSEHRIEPDCSVFQKCGGCDFRHITYEEELRAKLSRINDALRRIGNVSLQLKEIIKTGKSDGYRNKAIFHTARCGTQTIIGFYACNSHEVVPITNCLLLCEELNIALKDSWDNPPAIGSDIMLRKGMKNTSNKHFHVEMDELVFRISKFSFFQVNTDAALLLYQKAREYAALSKSETLLDLYCGVGTLTLFIGRDAGHSIGIESNLDSIDDARNNAKDNGLDNVDFICADAADWDIGNIRPDCVVIDPPRSGLSSEVVKQIQKIQPLRIVYISCDPATFARDIRLLDKYEIQKACAVDMFPRTANLECCALLKLKNIV